MSSCVPRILEWVAYPFSRDLPDPGIEPGSPALQVDSLPAHSFPESPGKPKNTGVGSLSLLQGIFQTQESNQGPMDCSLPGSSVHGIFQARVLEWGAIAFTAFPAHLRMRPVSRGNSRRATWVGPQAERPRFPGPPFILAWRIPMDRGAWKATVHGVAKNRTQLNS